MLFFVQARPVQEACVGEHDGQKIVDLVSHASGQLTDFFGVACGL